MSENPISLRYLRYLLRFILTTSDFLSQFKSMTYTQGSSTHNEATVLSVVTRSMYTCMQYACYVYSTTTPLTSTKTQRRFSVNHFFKKNFT